MTEKITKEFSRKPSMEKPWLNYYTKEQIEQAWNIPTETTVWDLMKAELKNDPKFPALEYFGNKISRGV